MSESLTSTFTDAAFGAADSAIDTVVTLTGRVPILASHLFSPSPDGLSEWHGAATEKVLATMEAASAALFGWQDVMWRSLFIPVTPAGLAHEALQLAEAVAEPGRRRLRANAARFRFGTS